MFARLTARRLVTTRRAVATLSRTAAARAFGSHAHAGVAPNPGSAARAWLSKALGGVAALAAGTAGVGLLLGTDPLLHVARADSAAASTPAPTTRGAPANDKRASKRQGTSMQAKLFFTASVVFMPIVLMIRFAGRKTRRGNLSMPLTGWAMTAVGYSGLLPEQLSVGLATVGCVSIPLSVGAYDMYTRRTGRTRQVTAMNRFVEGLPTQHPLVWQRLTGAGFPPLLKRPSPELGMPRSYTFAPLKADGTPAEVSSGTTQPKVELIQTSRAFDPNYNVNCLFYLNASHDFARVALRELLKPTAVTGGDPAKASLVSPYEITFGARKYQPFWFWNNRSAMDVTAAEQGVLDRIMATSDTDNRVQVVQYAWAMPPNPSNAPTGTTSKPQYLLTPRPNGADGDQTPPQQPIGEYVNVPGLSSTPVPAWDAIVRGVHGRMIETIYSVDAQGGTVVEWIDIRSDGARFLLHDGNGGVLPATNPKAGPGADAVAANATAHAATPDPAAAKK